MSPKARNYPLLTQKGGDFLLFKKAVKLIESKAHLNIEGFFKIVSLKASINLGLSEKLKSIFKNICPVERPIIKTETIPDPHWISGFVSGEGNFYIKISKSTNKIGHRVQLKFRIVQHSRDKRLMEIISKYFYTSQQVADVNRHKANSAVCVGSIYKYSEKLAVVLEIFNFSDIKNIILPFYRLWRRKISYIRCKTIRFFRLV